MKKSVNDLTDEQNSDLHRMAQAQFAAMTELGDMFIREHDLTEEHFVRALLGVCEAVTFAVVANFVNPTDHAVVVNNLSGGLLIRLKEYRRNPEAFKISKPPKDRFDA